MSLHVINNRSIAIKFTDSFFNGDLVNTAPALLINRCVEDSIPLVEVQIVDHS